MHRARFSRARRVPVLRRVLIDLIRPGATPCHKRAARLPAGGAVALFGHTSCLETVLGQEN